MNSKKYWIIILVIVGILGFGFIQSSRLKISQNAPSPTLFFQKPVMSTPTNAPSLALRQQCADNANRLVSSRQQVADKQWSYAHQYHTGYTTFSLNGSTFSQMYNTCVAEIDGTIVQDGKSIEFYYVYDTIDDKLLAQCGIDEKGSCDNSSFISPLLPEIKYIQSPNWADWADYKSLIGL